MKKAVVIITSTGATSYQSIRAAAKDTGISKDRLWRALHKPNGSVANTTPIICIDDQSEIAQSYSLSEKCLECSVWKGLANDAG